MRRPLRTVARHLRDSQKRLAAITGNARQIIEQAEAMEEEALADVRRYRRQLRTATGPAREIAQAGYMDALGRKQKAGQVGTMARLTRDKPSPGVPDSAVVGISRPSCNKNMMG